MYIKELIIEQFSGKVGERLTLEPTMNLITGENESGKSTYCAFIKYILYGFADTKEKDLRTSLLTGVSAGQLIIEHRDTLYRIERKGSGRTQSVTVYDEKTGDVFEKWKKTATTPGEYFLGIPQELYTRCAYISQTGGAKLDGKSSEAISNLLLTGDEAVNLKRAKKALDDTRKHLKLKKGVGGKIPENESKLKALRAKLDASLAAKKNVEALTIALQEENKKLSELSEKIAYAKSCLESRKSQDIRALDAQLKKAEQAKQETVLLHRELIKDNTYKGFLPDEKYETAVLSLQQQIEVYEKECAKAKKQLERIQTEMRLTPPAELDAFVAMGRREKIIPRFEKLFADFKLMGMIFFITCFVSLASAMAILLSILDVFSGSMTLIITLFSLSVVLAIISGVLRMFKQKDLLRFTGALGASHRRTPADICRDCEGYESRLQSSNIDYFVQECSDKQSQLEKKVSEINLLLSVWNKENAQQALSDYRFYTEKLAKLTKTATKIKQDLAVANAKLSGYTEAEIAQALNLPFEPGEDGVEIVTQDDLARLTEQFEEARKRKTDIKVELAASGAEQTDIELLREEIEDLENEIAHLKDGLDALLLAAETLEDAENTIRSTVSPYLSEHSSTYFDKITGGKYSTLRLDSDMNLSYAREGTESITDSAYLSTGSADLAWICLRLALHKRLSENEKIPLILDESLVYFDDVRLKLILKQLLEISKSGTQIILLSASSREAKMASKKVNVIKLGVEAGG